MDMVKNKGSGRLPILKRIKSSVRMLKRPKSHLKSSASSRSSSSSSSSPSAEGSNGFEVPSMAELESAFKMFDQNGDGLITWQEFGKGLRKVGQCGEVEEGVLKLIVKEADANGDGFIDFAEFVEMNRKNVNKEECVEDLKNAFDIFDVDGNGQISADELQRVFKNLGEKCTLEECGRMIEAADCNGDGFVNFEEFQVLMRRAPGPSQEL